MVLGRGANSDRLESARAALRTNDPLKAIVCIKAHLAVAADSAEAEELLGIAHARAGNRAKAHEALNRATELDPRRASAHYNRALLLDGDDEIDEAIEEVQTALLIKPDYAAAHALQQRLTTRLQDRAYRSDEQFALVDRDTKPLNRSDSDWIKLPCHNCGAQNFITARTCSRCGVYFAGEREVVPVE